MSRADVGHRGEDMAADYLSEAGMVLLARNWRPHGMAVRGELDIVARDGSILVACEVKTRRGVTHGTPAEAVTARKVAQLRRLLTCWRIAHGVTAPLRVDVVSVALAPGMPPRLDHLRGVG